MKKILVKLQKPADRVPHCHFNEKWHCIEQTKATGSVAAQCESHRSTVQGSREYAASIDDMLLCLRKQGFALRGHDESDASANRGNFLELCNWYARRDKAFCTRLNANLMNLMSPDTQNKFLEIASCLVKDKIIHGIKYFF